MRSCGYIAVVLGCSTHPRTSLQTAYRAVQRTRSPQVESMRQGIPSQSGSWLAALHLRATLTLPAHLRDGGVHRRCALLISHACLSEQALRDMRLMVTAHQKIPAWKDR